MTPLRAKLMSPPNAVPDTGINMRNGSVFREVREYLPCNWKTPKLTLLFEIPPLPPPPEPDPEPPPGVVKPRHTCRTIIAEVCLAWGVHEHEVLSQRRTWDIIMPRHAAMAIAYRLTPLSLPIIGRIFGRDHTSLLHAKNKMAPHIAALNQELTDWSTPAEWVRALKARLEA